MLEMLLGIINSWVAINRFSWISTYPHVTGTGFVFDATCCLSNIANSNELWAQPLMFLCEKMFDRSKH